MARSVARRIFVLAFAALLLIPAVPALASPEGALPPVPGWLSARDPGTADGLLVFDTPLDAATVRAVTTFGLTVVERFDFIDSLLVRGHTADLARALAIPGVASLYEEEGIALNLVTTRSVIHADTSGIPFAQAGLGVTVAVVDSGVDATHPALKDRVRESVKVTRGGVRPSSGDADGHGTHIAGIIAGSGAGSRDDRFHGVAPAADLVSVDISESFTTTNAVRAFEWIHENAERFNIRVVSNSWGREKESSRYDPSDPVVRASNALVARGLTVIFSAGNKGGDEGSLTIEAMNPNVITVGATSKTGRIEEYSSRGPAVDTSDRRLDWVKPDVVAPGTHVVSTRSSDRGAGLSGENAYYVEMNGTSMAAPHVAAAAAIILAAAPDLSPGIVQVLLQDTARDAGPDGPDWAYGYGMVDIEAAVRAAAANEPGGRVVTAERRIPFAASGSLVAAGENIVLANLEPALPPQGRISIPVTVPPGARALDFNLTWDGSAGDLVAYVRGPSSVEGPFKGDGKTITVSFSAPVPGAYRIEVHAKGPATIAAWRVAGVVTVLESHVVDADVQVRSAPRTGYLRDADFFSTFASGEALARLTEPETIAGLGLVAGIVAAVGIIGVNARKKR